MRWQEFQTDRYETDEYEFAEEQEYESDGQEVSEETDEAELATTPPEEPENIPVDKQSVAA